MLIILNVIKTYLKGNYWMKKYFVATLLSGLASISFADSFQDFNNNILN